MNRSASSSYSSLNFNHVNHRASYAGQAGEHQDIALRQLRQYLSELYPVGHFDAADLFLVDGLVGATCYFQLRYLVSQSGYLCDRARPCVSVLGYPIPFLSLDSRCISIITEL